MDKCVVRQAIKNVKEDEIIGYELLFQSNSEDLYDSDNRNAADTILNFLMNNSEKIFKDNRIFMTFTPALLFRNTPKLFEKDKVVIQIEENLLIHPLTLPMIKKYYNEGYKFAINDFKFAPKYFSILEYMEYIRIELNEDVTDREVDSIKNVMELTRSFNKKCIATGINSEELYNRALEFGFEYLEGAYIAELVTSKADKADYLEGNFFQLVIAITSEEPDLNEIEDIVSRDAGLSYALLKLVNSAYFALRKKTASIKQAIVTLGISQLRQWVYMLSFNRDNQIVNEELLKTSFLRAKFLEELINKTKRTELPKSEGYLIGMFSILPNIVDSTMEELIEEIPLSYDIKKALIDEEGLGGELLQLVKAYERADWKITHRISTNLQIPVELLSNTYIDCICEVNSIWDSLVSEFNKDELEDEEIKNENRVEIESDDDFEELDGPVLIDGVDPVQELLKAEIAKEEKAREAKVKKAKRAKKTEK